MRFMLAVVVGLVLTACGSSGDSDKPNAQTVNRDTLTERQRDAVARDTSDR